MFRKVSLLSQISVLSLLLLLLLFTQNNFMMAQVNAEEANHNLAEYLFDGDVKDHTSNGNDGDINGEVSFTDGLDGQAVEFKGGNITLPKEDISFEYNQDFSIAFWMKSKPVNDDVIISNKNWDSGQNQGWMIGIEDDFLLWNWKGSNANRLDLKNDKQIRVADNEWHHIVVVHERDGLAKFYKDGNLKEEIDIAGTGNINTELNLNLGADGEGDYQWNSGMIDNMLITQQLLSQEQIQEMYEEHKDKAIPNLEKFNGYIALIGTESSVKDSEFFENIHLHTKDMKYGVEQIRTTIQYDPEKFEFISGPDGITEDEDMPGILHVDLEGEKNFNNQKENDYKNTRIAQLRFKTKAKEGSGEFKIKNSEFSAYNQIYEIDELDEKGVTVEINDKDKLDVNEDGVITVSDLVEDSVSKDLRKQIAGKVNTEPYKHVVMIGIDGAGESIHEDAPYFESTGSKQEKVGDRLNIPNIRELIEGGAVTYSAESVMPSMSSPNWGAMLTGVGYDKHEINNEESGKWYYQKDKYPTIFKTIREQMPQTKLAAFSNWPNITEGQIEPSVGVEKYNDNDDDLADEIHQYITGDKMKDTSLVFMQFDDVDHAGHNKGFYTKEYYNALHEVDKNVKKVVDAIDRAGIRDETLILLSPDHGGGTEQEDGRYTNQYDHGQDSKLARTTFLGANGRTIPTDNNGEKVLQGGSTKDIANAILSGLNLDNKKTDDSELINEMFAKQSDFSDEDSPTITLQRETDGLYYDFILDNQNKMKSTDTMALELNLDINGVTTTNIESHDGVDILYTNEENDTLKIVATIDSSVPLDESLIKVLTEKHHNKNQLSFSDGYIANGQGKDVMLNLESEERQIDINGIQSLVRKNSEEDAFENDSVEHALKIHLKAVDHFTNQNKDDKVIKHLKGFKDLLKHHKNKDTITKKAYDDLVSNTNKLIDKWE